MTGKDWRTHRSKCAPQENSSVYVSVHTHRQISSCPPCQGLSQLLYWLAVNSLWTMCSDWLQVQSQLTWPYELARHDLGNCTNFWPKPYKKLLHPQRNPGTLRKGGRAMAKCTATTRFPGTLHFNTTAAQRQYLRLLLRLQCLSNYFLLTTSRHCHMSW